MKTQPLKIGDRVRYSRNFLRAIVAPATDPMWRRAGPVVGLGTTATTWHCGACREELGIQSPAGGRVSYSPPATSPCCHAAVTVKQHLPTRHSEEMFVRVKFDGDTFETAIHRTNLSRISHPATSEAASY